MGKKQKKSGQRPKNQEFGNKIFPEQFFSTSSRKHKGQTHKKHNRHGSGVRQESLVCPLPENQFIPNTFSNFHLRFHRFQPLPEIKPETNADTWKLEKEKLWKQIKSDSNNNIQLSPAETIVQLTKKIADLAPHNIRLHYTLSLVSRMCVGSGEISSLETGILLHPLYGLPYIPASTIKGVVRSVWLNDIALQHNIIFDENSEKAWQQAEKLDNEFQICFGNQEQRGRVYFFDAFPVYQDKPLFELDIINPHYGDYYQKKEPPADYLSPVPNNFLVVKPKTIFEFCLIISIKQQKAREQLRQKIEKYFYLAVTEAGIGSKTSLGYGLFKKPDA